MPDFDLSKLGDFGVVLEFIANLFKVLYEAAFKLRGFGWLWDNLFPAKDDTTDDTTV